MAWSSCCTQNFKTLICFVCGIQSSDFCIEKEDTKSYNDEKISLGLQSLHCKSITQMWEMSFSLSCLLANLPSFYSYKSVQVSNPALSKKSRDHQINAYSPLWSLVRLTWAFPTKKHSNLKSESTCSGCLSSFDWAVMVAQWHNQQLETQDHGPGSTLPWASNSGCLTTRSMSHVQVEVPQC